MRPTILLIDGDQETQAATARGLEQGGYRVLRASRGADGLAIAARQRPDLVLLDLVLPDMPGSEVCRRLDAGEPTRGVPIVIVSSRGSEIDRVVGFELGATDYVVKPYSLRELMLRIRAVLRRNRPPREKGRLCAGGITVDVEGFVARVGDEPIDLTPRELDLLVALLRARGQVLSRSELVRAAWEGAEVMERTVDAHVMRLRGKLGRAGRRIETVRGVGYRVRADLDERSMSPPG